MPASAFDPSSPAAPAWQQLIERLPCAIVVFDADDRITLFNQAFRQTHPGLEDQIVPGCRFEDLLRVALERGLIDAARGREADFLAERMAAHRAPGEPLVRQHADGRWRRITEMRLPDGGLLAFGVDVSHEMRQAEHLRVALDEARIARERLADAIEALPDGFALFDADDRLVLCNARYREIFAATGDAIRIGARFEDVLREGVARGQFPQAVGREAAWLDDRLAAHRRPGAPEIHQLPGDRWVRIDERVTRDGGVAGVRTDVTELVRREHQLVELNARLTETRQRLEQLSETDALTGIANRRQFDRRLADEWSRVVRHGSTLTLMIADVDHFKRYNDLHGHQAGDACLRQVADILARGARRPSDLVARYGGEEFAILLPHIEAGAAARQAMRLVAAVDAARIPHGDSPVAAHVTLSVGVARVSQGRPGGQDALVQAADRALYRAKAAGRHRAEFA